MQQKQNCQQLRKVWNYNFQFMIMNCWGCSINNLKIEIKFTQTNVIHQINIDNQQMKKSNCQTTQGVSRNEHSQLDLKSIQVSECRICFGAETEDKQKMISPCNCTGSLKYVHNECMRNWIGKIVGDHKKNIQGNKAFICCEVCKQRVFFKINSSLVCKNGQEIKSGFKESYRLFIALVLLVITNLGFFSALLNYLVFIGFRTLKQNNVVLVSFIISGQVIFSIVTLVTVGTIIKKFFLKNHFQMDIVGGRSNKILR